MTACSKSGDPSASGRSSASGGGKSLNSAADLKAYLDKQPVNSPDKPVKIAMKVNDVMIESVADVIREAGKYVSLDLSGSPLTEIWVFGGCEALVSITLPDSVTHIDDTAFMSCTRLTSITIPGGLKYIGFEAFSYCNSLASITIPASVTFIDRRAFYPWGPSQTINIQGKANYEATITAGWDEYWKQYCDAKIVYSGGEKTSAIDPNLNGTWTREVEGRTLAHVLNNGVFERLSDGKPYAKGTYTASNGKITTSPTHTYRDEGTTSGWVAIEAYLYTEDYAVKGTTLTYTGEQGVFAYTKQ